MSAPVNLDSLDLSGLVSAASMLLAQLERYNRWAATAQERVEFGALSQWSQVGFAVLAVETELVKLGLPPNPPVLVVQGKQVSTVQCLREWLLVAREGSADGWGERVAGLWVVATGTKSLPKVPGSLERLRLIVEELSPAADQLPEGSARGCQAQQQTSAPPKQPGATIPLLSVDDLLRYRLTLDRAIRAWGLLAGHVRAQLTAALRRAHGEILRDGFEGGPDLPRAFSDACTTFREALGELHAFDQSPPAFPWPTWGGRALAPTGPIPDLEG
jgi:hypothetical protein